MLNRSKNRKEKTPLLESHSAATTSDGTSLRRSRSGGLRRLFGRSRSEVSQQEEDKSHQVETREPKTNKTRSTETTTESQKKKASSNSWKRTSSNKQTERTTTPPRLLHENVRDTAKKERPFPVSVRKVPSNPHAVDPPAASSSRRSRSHYSKSTPTFAANEMEHSYREEKKTEEEGPFVVENRPASSSSFEVVYNNNKQSSADALRTTKSQNAPVVSKSKITPPRKAKNADNGASPPSPSHVASRITGPRKPGDKTKALLSRPFGRSSLPPEITRKWVVEVSSAEWDADEQRWKYRILVQRRQLTDAGDQADASVHNSFTAAFTWRSLADFLWLERALRREFAGGLLLPLLSIALGRPVDSNLEGMPVEAEKLRNWFSDVLNGVRGQGEWILDHHHHHHHHSSIDLLKSESMEVFLYRRAGPLALEGDPGEYVRPRETQDSGQEDSFMQTLLTKPLCIVPLDLCVGPDPQSTDVSEDNGDKRSMRLGIAKKLPVDMITCQSRALGSATSLDVQDSFVDHATIASMRESSALAVHSELIEAEKDLALNYRKNALLVMEKLQRLTEDEEKIGGAWKRVAICISNLFAYEKDVENARLGDSKIKRENMPYRKLAKSTVEDCLRVVARQKTERSVPALQALNAMLSAYAADLSAVEPSVEAYNEAIMNLAFLGDSSDSASRGPKPTKSWEERVRALASSTMDDMKRQAMRSFNSRQAKLSRAGITEQSGASQHRLYQDRVLANEQLLRHSLTTMCRSTSIRVARMAWRYWNTEATQCALLNTAAVTMKSKVDIANKDSISKMITRHLKEEKEDDTAELKLVQRIVKIGSVKKFSDENDGSSSARRAKAVDIARERTGRWDAKLALAIMEAVGVDDPNVRVEETTRDLRLVRRYAVGLRENLNRCIEAVQLLRVAIAGETKRASNASVKGDSLKRIHASRKEFVVEQSKLFSGTFITKHGERMPKRSSPSVSILTRAGINTGDPFGWSSAYTSSHRGSRSTLSHGRLGDLAISYVDARDAQTDWLLNSMSDLLNEYYERIEIVEGFVYMECVGIQLEKHFNHKRTSALSAFEKKTDITAAINVATRKRLPKLVEELQAKADRLGPDVCHTLVKETKELHLESKNLKAELHTLAMRRLMRARETSTERVVTLLTLWAKEEESASTAELKALGEAMTALERATGEQDAEALMYSSDQTK